MRFTSLIRHSLFLMTLLFIVAFFPRFYLLSEAEIYPDEITWTVRSKEVFQALRQPNYAYFSEAWWNKKTDTEATALPLTLAGGLSMRLFGQTVSTHSFKLLSDIDAVRLPVVILSSIFIVLFFFYLRQLVEPKIAFLVALLLALDPILLALSRWGLNDSLLTIFTSLSLISFLVDVKKQRLTPIPGIFLALSFLTKPNGLVPLVGWILMIILYREQKRIYIFILNLSVFAVLVFLLWPSMWTNPVYFFEYLIRQTQLTQSGIANYFLGVTTNNPPFYYYLFQIGTRLPPLIVIGFLGIAVTVISHIYKFRALKKFILDRPERMVIIIYFILFYFVIALTPKKLGVRYVLPLWPWIYLGCVLWWEKIAKYSPRYTLYLFSALIFLSLYIYVIYTPKLYLYYNFFIGGPTAAQSYDLPNLCLGAKSTAAYINSFYPYISKITYLGCGSTTFPYYSGVPITTNIQDKSDLIILEDAYMKLKPNEPSIKYIHFLTPLAIISEKGVILSRIYSANFKHEF